MQEQARLLTNNNDISDVVNRDNGAVKEEEEEEEEEEVVEANAKDVAKTSEIKEEPLFVNNAKTTSRNVRDDKQEVKGTIASRKRGKSCHGRQNHSLKGVG
jgi:hypothetical protein